MNLQSGDVLKIARLARLQIKEDDVESYARDLSEILDLVEQMDSVNTEDIQPMAHPLEHSQRLRDDVVSERDERELFQSQATQVEAGLYLVPKVIE